LRRIEAIMIESIHKHSIFKLYFIL